MSGDSLVTQEGLDLAMEALADDRAANRAGRLSGRQRRRLLGRVALTLAATLLALIFGAVAAVENLALTAVALTAAALLAQRIWGTVRDVVLARVGFAEGRVERAGLFLAVIGRARIHFPPGVLDALPPEVDVWRVYYLPSSRRALALEPAASVDGGPFR